MSLAQDTSVKPIDSHSYSAFFPQKWCIGSAQASADILFVPHGGFVSSCILSALASHFASTLRIHNQPDTLALHLSFLRRTSAGPATITLREVKLGRTTSNVHIRLRSGSRAAPNDDDHDEVVGYAIQSNLAAQTGLTLPTRWTLMPAPRPVELEALRRGEDIHWAAVEAVPFSAFRKASTDLQFCLPRAGQLERSVVDEWLRWKTGARFATSDLGYVADMFPQVVEAFRDLLPLPLPAEKKKKKKKEEGEEGVEGNEKEKQRETRKAAFWYPTLMLNLEIKKALPPEGAEWLFVRVRAREIKNGRMDLDVAIFDEAGELVALSSHVAMILSAERNLAPRSGKL